MLGLVMRRSLLTHVCGYQVRNEPIGVVLVIGAFNAPLQVLDALCLRALLRCSFLTQGMILPVNDEDLGLEHGEWQLLRDEVL